MLGSLTTRAGIGVKDSTRKRRLSLIDLKEQDSDVEDKHRSVATSTTFVGPVGLEPTTNGLKARCSAKLS